VGMSPGPSCLVCPSLSRPGGTEAHARAQETLIPGDSASQEARRTCRERLRLQMLKRWVVDDLELMCSWTACMGKTSLVASSLDDRGVITASPHQWLQRDGVRMLGSSPRCISSEGCLPKIIMTASSPGKGTASPSMGASSISMPWIGTLWS
jgi:hypothetical protein